MPFLRWLWGASACGPQAGGTSTGDAGFSGRPMRRLGLLLQVTCSTHLGMHCYVLLAAVAPRPMRAVWWFCTIAMVALLAMLTAPLAV